MSMVILLEQLKEFTENATRNIILPVSYQKGDPEPPPPRAAEVFRARLPDSKAAKKKAPYILHQIMTNKDAQNEGILLDSEAVVRTIFCVYHPDEQQGGVALLSLMDQLRISFLERVVVGAQFRLDLEAGIEVLVYPEDTAPYYAGEMVTTWHLPPVKRLDTTRVIHGMPPWDPNARHLEEIIGLKGSEEHGEKQ